GAGDELGIDERGHPDPDHLGRACVPADGLGAHVVERGQGPLDARQHRLAERGRRHPAGRTVEQSVAERRLELGDPVGQRRLGDAVGLRRGAERPGLRDRPHVAHSLGAHPLVPFSHTAMLSPDSLSSSTQDASAPVASRGRDFGAGGGERGGHGDDDGGPPARRRWTQPRGASPDTSTIGDPAFAQPIHDRIHWASAEAAPAYAAHLEGAALVRLRAAEAIRTAVHPCADRATARPRRPPICTTASSPCPNCSPSTTGPWPTPRTSGGISTPTRSSGDRTRTPRPSAGTWATKRTSPTSWSATSPPPNRVPTPTSTGSWTPPTPSSSAARCRPSAACVPSDPPSPSASTTASEPSPPATSQHPTSSS